MPDGVEEVAGVDEPLHRIARGGPPDQLVELLGNAGLDRGRSRHVVVDVAAHDDEVSRAGVRSAAGQQLAEHHAGGVHVGTRRRALAERLLR